MIKNTPQFVLITNKNDFGICQKLAILDLKIHKLPLCYLKQKRYGVLGHNPHHQKIEFKWYTGFNFKVLIIIHKKFFHIDSRGFPHRLSQAVHVMCSSLSVSKKFSTFWKVTKESKFQFKISVSYVIIISHVMWRNTLFSNSINLLKNRFVFIFMRHQITLVLKWNLLYFFHVINSIKILNNKLFHSFLCIFTINKIHF